MNTALTNTQNGATLTYEIPYANQIAILSEVTQVTIEFLQYGTTNLLDPSLVLTETFTVNLVCGTQPVTFSFDAISDIVHDLNIQQGYTCSQVTTQFEPSSCGYGFDFEV